MKHKCKNLLLTTTILSLFSCARTNNKPIEKIDETYTVRFLANIPNVNITLSSGANATADNILYESKSVKKNENVSQPNNNPSRVGYDFAGWYKEKDTINLYDFTSPVSSNLNLYAKWNRKSIDDNETYKEIELSFVEKIDDTIQDIEITGVLNSKIDSGNVKLTSIGIKKLKENSSDVKRLLNYKINSNYHITTAIYNSNVITINYQKNDGPALIKTITVIDVSSSLVDGNSLYENKAKKFEKEKDIDPYKVVLCGSSSIENWSTSTLDCNPLTTINVGIGGTTIEQWSTTFAQRLVYPFSPRAVVCYVGINNVINSKDSGPIIGNKLTTLFDDVHSHLPNTQIYYILMNLIPNFMQFKNVIEEGNSLALEYGKNKSFMTYIDAGKLLMKESGIPNTAYFLSDGLHMSLYGYVLWGEQVKQSVIEKEKELYK